MGPRVQVPRGTPLPPEAPLELDARTARGDIRLAGHVCVIGAGPVGLAVAETLRGRGIEVVILESGGTAPDARTRELDLGERVREAYTDLREVRARGIGGTATTWNTVLHGVPMAKYAPLDGIDLEERPWIPHSGWPFARAELDPWYQRAHVLCGLEPYGPKLEPDPCGYPLLAFPQGGLRTGVYHYGPASRFTAEIPAALCSAPGVTLAHGATVTGIARDLDGRVHEVRWRSFGEGSGTVRASSFVLAAGGLENARLLLLAHGGGGRAEPASWLGAGFMEHPVDASLELVTHAPALVPPEGFYSPAGVGTIRAVVGRIALDAELLRSEGLPNASIRLVHLEGPPALRAASARRAAHRLVPGAALRRAIGGAVRRVWRASASRVGCTYRVLVDLEQLPSPENRVSLSGQRDAFGVPRLRVDWRWTEADEANRRRLLAVVERELVRARVGRVTRVASTGPDPAAHHLMGTTRMHADPAGGVVDGDLRVHGSDNLYVAGSSVFPTGGFANPTLTAVALAVRLGEHLADA